MAELVRHRARHIGVVFHVDKAVAVLARHVARVANLRTIDQEEVKFILVHRPCGLESPDNFAHARAVHRSENGALDGTLSFNCFIYLVKTLPFESSIQMTPLNAVSYKAKVLNPLHFKPFRYFSSMV
jgi:hypothetical protein